MKRGMLKQNIEKMGSRLVSALLIVALLAVGVFGASGASAKSNIRCRRVALNAARVTLGVGDIATLTAIMRPANATDRLTWSTTNKAVATVNAYGVITAKKEGKATISVRTSSKKTSKCAVVVKQTLSRKEIEKLIDTKMPSQETIKKWIAQYSLTEDQVKQLIAENQVSEETVKKLVADNSMTEDQVKQLITENTLSRADVSKMIREEGSSSAAWADGTLVAMTAAQKLPYVVSDPHSQNIVGQITDLQVKKSRVTSEFMNNGKRTYLPYKYDILLNASVSSITEAQKNTYCIKLEMGSVDVAEDIAPISVNNVVSYTDNKLMQMMVLYSAYDISSYFIQTASWELKTNP